MELDRCWGYGAVIIALYHVKRHFAVSDPGLGIKSGGSDFLIVTSV